MNRTFASVLALVFGTACFGAAIALRHYINPWWANTAAALLCIAIAVVILRPNLQGLFAVRFRGIAVAVVLGVAMVIATHLAFSLAVQWVPEWRTHVLTLYGDIRNTTPGPAVRVPLIALIVVAEEFLWRGVGYALCERKFSGAMAVVSATILYALPQFIGGEWMLVLAALLLGAVFTIQRRVTKRMTDAVITHAIWSTSIFSLWPLV